MGTVVSPWREYHPSRPSARSPPRASDLFANVEEHHRESLAVQCHPRLRSCGATHGTQSSSVISAPLVCSTGPNGSPFS